MTPDTTPYLTLDPHVILNAIEHQGFLCTGSLFALNSYENRVYQVGIENHPPLIAKFYRPGRWSDATILEEHQFSLTLAEHEIPVVAPLQNTQGDTLFHEGDFRFSLFPRWRGRALEVENLNQLAWMGRFIGRMHAIGATKKFEHRLTLDLTTYGIEPVRFLIENNFIPAHLKIKFVETARIIFEKIEARFHAAAPLNYLRLHGDLHAGNVLWNEEGPHIVDLDDCLMGPAIQDLWMLLSGNPNQRQLELNALLSGYEDFYEFHDRELLLIESLRALRQLHYAAWLAKRWEDPAFPLNFPWFNTPDYWEEQYQDLLEHKDSI